MAEKKQFFIHGGQYDKSGNGSCFFTRSVEFKEKPLRHHLQGLTFTATGYGSRIPTRYMVKFNEKWRRVYCRVYSNAGTYFIGKLPAVGERLIVQEFGAE